MTVRVTDFFADVAVSEYATATVNTTGKNNEISIDGIDF